MEFINWLNGLDWADQILIFSVAIVLNHYFIHPTMVFYRALMMRKTAVHNNHVAFLERLNGKKDEESA